MGFPWSAALVIRGMGFYPWGGRMSGHFRRAALEGKIKARTTLLLRSALAEAVTVSVTRAGNEKLSKRHGKWSKKKSAG